jgi:hypothetical protein
MNILLNLPMKQKKMPESSADVGKNVVFVKKIPAVFFYEIVAMLTILEDDAWNAP